MERPASKHEPDHVEPLELLDVLRFRAMLKANPKLKALKALKRRPKDAA